MVIAKILCYNMKKLMSMKDKTLKDIIKEKGFTIATFCQEVDLDPSYLWEIRKGKKNPTVDVAMRICKTLKISLKELLIYLGKDVTGIPNDE